MKKIILFITLFLISGCAINLIKQVEINQIIPMKEPNSKQVQFKGLIFKIQHNSALGSAYGGYLCVPRGQLNFVKPVAESLQDTFQEIFLTEFESSGYRVAKNPNSVFESTIDKNTELLIAGSVKEIQTNACHSPSQQVKGSSYVKINWEVYSVSEEKVIYEMTTEGSALVEDFIEGKTSPLFLKAYTAALRNLLSNKDFFQVALKGPSQ